MREYLIKYFREKKIEFTEATDEQFSLKICISCGDAKGHHFYMSQTEGLWDCKKCGAKGNLNQFRKLLGDAEIDLAKFSGTNKKFTKKEYRSLNYNVPIQYASRLWALEPDIQDYLLAERKIKKETLEKYKIGYNGTSISIPLYDKDKLVNIKYRRDPRKDKDENASPRYSQEKGCRPTLFNGDVLNEPLTTCYVTEGSFDAMQLLQLGIRNVVGVTLGAGYFAKEWIAKFQEVKIIYLVFDNDQAGRDGVKNVANLLGVDKCKVVTLPLKDGRSKTDVTNYFVDDGFTKTDFLEVVKSAKGVRSVESDSIKHISEFNEELRKRLLEGEYLGEGTGYEMLDEVLGGLRKGRLIIISGLTSTGKCVVATSTVMNPISGAICTMEEFVKQKKKYILGWEYDRIRKRKVLDWIDSGVKDVYKVTTAWGTECIVTKEHPFLSRGIVWKELQYLKEGDEIAIPKYLPVWKCGDKSAKEYEVKLLAYFIAEGSCSTDKKMGFTNTDEDIVKDFLSCVDQIGDRASIHGKDKITYWISRGDKKYLKKVLVDDSVRTSKLGNKHLIKAHLSTIKCKANCFKLWDKAGLKRVTSHFKEVPKKIFTLKPKLISLFLRCLFDCDGCIDNKGVLSYCSASKKLAYQVRHLLLRFGIDFSIRVKTTNFNTVAYELCCSDIIMVRKFKEEIDFGCKRKQDKLKEAIKKIPRSNKYSNSALRFTKIRSIEYLGKRQVYDLSVEESKNFIVDDMLVHNTSFSLNIALNMAKRKLPVFYFSLEMPPIDIAKKILMLEAKLTNTQLKDIEDPSDVLNDVDKTLAGFSDVDAMPIYMYKNAGTVRYKILAECARIVKEEYGAECIFVDHLHYFARSSNNVTAETSVIVRDIKQLAMQLDIPIVLLTHLNRGGRATQRKGLYLPGLSDLRDTGVIEQDADQVLFVCRDSENDDVAERQKSLIKIAKNRDGYAGRTISMRFDEELTTFIEEKKGVDYAMEIKKDKEEKGKEVLKDTDSDLPF